MTLISPRASHLAYIKDLVVLISNEEMTIQRQLDDFLARRMGWLRTRRYHYLSALRDLHFIRTEKGTIYLDTFGYELAKVAKYKDFSALELEEKEKEIFKQALRHHEPFVDFMSMFISSGERFQDYEQLLALGKRAIFKPNTRVRQWVVITASQREVRMTKAHVVGIIWTLKNWARILDIIDEIYLERAKANSFGRDYRVFYPIKTRIQDLDQDSFREKIDTLIAENYESSYIPISLLMNDFCLRYYTSTSTFVDRLVDLYRSFPHLYWLEKSNVTYIDRRPHCLLRNYPEHRYTNYPRVTDVYRSVFVVRDELYRRLKYGFSRAESGSGTARQ